MLIHKNLMTRTVARRLLFLFLTFVLLTLFVVACSKPYEVKGSEFPVLNPASEIVGRVGDADFQLGQLDGKVIVIFFGFTHCPDVCPITMAEVRQAYEQSGGNADEMAVVFVTVDPERDTPENLDAYVSAFDDDFYGVYVPLAEQESLKDAYYVFAEKEYPDGVTAGDTYQVAHTDNIYVVDRSGDLRLLYRASDLVIEDLAADLKHLLAN